LLFQPCSEGFEAGAPDDVLLVRPDDVVLDDVVLLVHRDDDVLLVYRRGVSHVRERRPDPPLHPRRLQSVPARSVEGSGCRPLDSYYNSSVRNTRF
jgi:hypothetical protein